jgi:3-hydroxy acid dehydrogenase/malonic semialdehyde reductase
MIQTPLAQRRILITGASRGIGAAIAKRLLADGARVIGIARDFSSWRQMPDGFSPVPVDLSDLDALPERLKRVQDEHPGIDGVICNAGSGRFGALEQFSAQHIRAMVDLNLTQHLLVARAMLPSLKRRDFGDLLFMGSEAALAGGRNGAVYAACKFALRGLAQSLRQEGAAAGVRVGLVNPGMVDTGFFDQLDFRPGELPENHIRPEDVAEAVVTMLSTPPGTVIDEINLSPLKKVVRFGNKKTL